MRNDSDRNQYSSSIGGHAHTNDHTLIWRGRQCLHRDTYNMITARMCPRGSINNIFLSRAATEPALSKESYEHPFESGISSEPGKIVHSCDYLSHKISMRVI